MARPVYRWLRTGFCTVSHCGFCFSSIWHRLFHALLNFHNVARIPVVLIVLLTGSLAENLVFRGYPFQRLVEAIGAGGEINTIIFRIVCPRTFDESRVEPMGIDQHRRHWSRALRCLFAYARSMAALGNSFRLEATLGLVFGLPVSGIRLFNVVLRTTSAGPAWLTGGIYGLEASIPGASVVHRSARGVARSTAPFG